MTHFLLPRLDARTLLVSVLLALGLTPACKCNTPPLTQINVCQGIASGQAGRNDACGDSTECSDHYACREQRDRSNVKCCVFAERQCQTSADCCPGQGCGSLQRCDDKRDICTTNDDCSNKPGQVCEIYTDSTVTEGRCRYPACGDGGVCSNGLSCFQGECLSGLPCDGSCPSGQACVPSANNDFKCQDYSTPTGRPMAACPVTCNQGFIGTFNDNRNIWDSCVLPNVQCVCAELPPLVSNDLGRFSAIAAEPTKGVYVSMYDGQFGDLAVARYGLDGARASIEYVDGVPSGGQATYGISGPRGGITDPGPDVGRYTDVAVSATGVVYVSYYDVTNGDLKVAIKGANHTWASHRVDGATADVGLYTSIAIDSAGLPGISYFQRAGETGFQLSDCPTPPTGPVKYITALKFARATTPTPSSASDWQVKTLTCEARAAPVCDGCTTNCVAVAGGVPQCLTTGAGCTGCAASDVCVSLNSQNVCGKKYDVADLAQVPEGVGLFTGLTFQDRDAIVVFQRRIAPAQTNGTKPVADADLYTVRLSPTNTPGAAVLLDATGDTGYFADVKIDPATHAIAVSYFDSSTKSLKYLSAPALAAGLTPEVVDHGVSTADPGVQAFVGADSSVVFGPSGKQWVLYQDATHGDLMLAKRLGANSWQALPAVSSMGAVGFFADGVFTDGKVYASHARLRAKVVGGVPSVDNSLLVEQFTGN